MNGDNGQYADLESNVEYTNTEDISEATQSLLNHHGNSSNSNFSSNKPNKSKFLSKGYVFTICNMSYYNYMPFAFEKDYSPFRILCLLYVIRARVFK